MNNPAPRLTDNITAFLQTAWPEAKSQTTAPAETATEAFTDAQQAATAALKLLFASVHDRASRRRLLRDGTAVAVATYYLEAELIRFGENDLAGDLAKLVAKRLVALFGGNQSPDEMPAVVTSEPKPLLDPPTTAETVDIIATRAAFVVFREGLRDFATLHPASETLHCMLRHRALLVAYDLLIPYHDRTGAIRRASIIVNACAQDLQTIFAEAMTGSDMRLH